MKYFIHKDERRILYDFAYPSSKVLIANKDCILGNGEYHKKKDELVMLVNGQGVIIIDGKKKQMKLYQLFEIKRRERHTFKLKEGSVLLEWATSYYKPNDVYQDAKN